MSNNKQPRGRYFEDFEVGQEFESPARTITLTDIINFAKLIDVRRGTIVDSISPSAIAPDDVKVSFGTKLFELRRRKPSAQKAQTTSLGGIFVMVAVVKSAQRSEARSRSDRNLMKTQHR